MPCKMEGEQEEAAVLPGSPAPRCQCWGDSSASLGPRFSLYYRGGTGCKTARNCNKTPRRRGYGSRLLRFPGNCRIGGAAGAEKITRGQGGGFWNQSAGRQLAAGRGFAFNQGQVPGAAERQNAGTAPSCPGVTASPAPGCTRGACPLADAWGGGCPWECEGFCSTPKHRPRGTRQSPHRAAVGPTHPKLPLT